MTTKEDVEKVFNTLEREGRNSVALLDLDWLQTQLMLEMRDLLAEQVRLLERSNRAQG